MNNGKTKVLLTRSFCCSSENIWHLYGHKRALLWTRAQFEYIKEPNFHEGATKK